jgi:hypothetical protein
MTPGLDLGRKRHSGIGGIFGVGAGPLKGAKLAKPSTPPRPSCNSGTAERLERVGGGTVPVFRSFRRVTSPLTRRVRE